MTRDPLPTQQPRERVLVCGVQLPGAPVEFEGELSEVSALAAASDAEVVGEAIIQKRRRRDARSLMGKGKVEEVRQQVERYRPDAVVFDNDLSPAQVRNLEKAWGTRVIDRSELILDIFSRRAQTRQARLQVELAQNEYLLPRLRRMWPHLERTEGAIGTRGPGETQLETDRRLLDKRITELLVKGLTKLTRAVCQSAIEEAWLICTAVPGVVKPGRSADRLPRAALFQATSFGTKPIMSPKNLKAAIVRPIAASGIPLALTNWGVMPPSGRFLVLNL